MKYDIIQIATEIDTTYDFVGFRHEHGIDMLYWKNLQDPTEKRLWFSFIHEIIPSFSDAPFIYQTFQTISKGVTEYLKIWMFDRLIKKYVHLSREDRQMLLQDAAFSDDEVDSGQIIFQNIMNTYQALTGVTQIQNELWVFVSSDEEGWEIVNLDQYTRHSLDDMNITHETLRDLLLRRVRELYLKHIFSSVNK